MFNTEYFKGLPFGGPFFIAFYSLIFYIVLFIIFHSSLNISHSNTLFLRIFDELCLNG